MPPLHPTRKVRTVFGERRRWRRRKPDAGVAGQLLVAGAASPAAVLNLAEGGACVESPLALAAGDALTLLLFNRTCLATLTAEARVIWSVPVPGGCRAGLGFEPPCGAAELLPFFS